MFVLSLLLAKKLKIIAFRTNEEVINLLKLNIEYKKVIYPAMTAFTDQYSLPNIFFYIGQL